MEVLNIVIALDREDFLYLSLWQKSLISLVEKLLFCPSSRWWSGLTRTDKIVHCPPLHHKFHGVQYTRNHGACFPDQFVHLSMSSLLHLSLQSLFIFMGFKCTEP